MDHSSQSLHFNQATLLLIWKYAIQSVQSNSLPVNDESSQIILYKDDDLIEEN